MEIAALGALASLTSVVGTAPAPAGLLGTILSLSVERQLTPTSALFTTSFTRSAPVTAGSVELADVYSLFDPNEPVPPGFAQGLVNTSIDTGNSFTTIDFDNAASSRVASGNQNLHVFTFSTEARATITGATIDLSVTTLGLGRRSTAGLAVQA